MNVGDRGKQARITTSGVGGTGGPWALVDRGHWLIMDTNGPWALVDHGHWWTMGTG